MWAYGNEGHYGIWFETGEPVQELPGMKYMPGHILQRKLIRPYKGSWSDQHIHHMMMDAYGRTYAIVVSELPEEVETAA